MFERTLPPGHVNLNVGGPPLHPVTIKMFEDAMNRAKLGATPAAPHTPPKITASAKLSELVAGCVAQGMSEREAKSHVYGIYRELVAEWAAELATDLDSKAMLSATPAAIAHRCEAIREWNSNPSARVGFTSIANYVAAREAQTLGRLRTVGGTRPGANRTR